MAEMFQQQQQDPLSSDDEDDMLDTGDAGPAGAAGALFEGDGAAGGAGLNISGPTEAQQRESLLMRFCPADSSLLYPKEDKRSKTLQYACRLCTYTEPAANQPLVYRYDLKKEVGNILHTVPASVADDPTLPRSYNSNCANCGNNEAVFFMSDSQQADSLALIFVCCNCGHKWVN